MELQEVQVTGYHGDWLNVCYSMENEKLYL